MKKKILIFGCIILLIPAILAWAHWANDPARVFITNYKRAETSFKNGNYDHAIDLLQATLEQVKEFAPGSPDHVEILASLCLSYSEIKEYQKAESACKEALGLAEKIYDKQSFTVLELRMQLGKIQREITRTY